MLSLNINKIVNKSGKTLWEWSVEHVVNNVSDSKVQIHDRKCRAFLDSHTYLKTDYKTNAHLTENKAIFFKPLGKQLLSKKEGNVQTQAT